MLRDLVPQSSRKADRLRVEIHGDRASMGAAAAYAVARRMRSLMAEKGRVVMVFASAPSQNEFLATLASLEGLNWGKVIAFHMDEYVGLSEEAPQRFRNYLRQHLFDIVCPGQIHLIDGSASHLEEECRRYAGLLETYPVDIVCAGIGENGHLAFNDPGVADFEDRERVRVVELDERSRWQQVHDGCFSDIGEVPRKAITLTIPALMAAPCLYCIVPGSSKAQAVKLTIKAPVDTECPATILRRHPCATLFLDKDSASLL